MSQPICNIGAQEIATWKRVQKLTLCRQLLQRCCDEYTERHAVPMEIDDRNFTTAFFEWLDVVTHHAAYRQQNPVDYFHFAFGVLLRDLLREKAICVKADASAQLRPSPDNIADWWPSGYVLTYFCVGTLRHALHEECATEVQPSDALSQPAVWQSFRENIIEEPGLAIAYFDKFMGIEPNWREPSQVMNRPAAARHESKV
jgi:hypothetical protein